MITSEQVEKITNELLSGSDKFLVEVHVGAGNRITVYFDSDTNVSIEDCRKLSKLIENKLDREKEDFDLTVSSSGMDRPLKILRQYSKRIGKELEVHTTQGEKISGILADVSPASIELEHPAKKPGKEIPKPNTTIDFTTIKSAKVIITIGK